MKGGGNLEIKRKVVKEDPSDYTKHVTDNNGSHCSKLLRRINER